MRTFSLRSKDNFGFGFSAVVVDAIQDVLHFFFGQRRRRLPEPTNPVTRGVERTTCQV